MRVERHLHVLAHRQRGEGRGDLEGAADAQAPDGARPQADDVAPAQVHTLQNWFNPCAFAPAADGELGNANRAPLYGPRFVNTDLSFIKHFPLPYEGMRLDFRAEFFNVWNHAQFFLDGGGNSHMQQLNIATNFAKVNKTVNNPRVLQFALKLMF